ncbi:MAG TPA: sensor histidine kinase [Candidatus Angelobacter sp.]|nr:sensor histidine kinase [Candidatus Angelobacter sp.]
MKKADCFSRSFNKRTEIPDMSLKGTSSERSPTVALILGLLVTLAAVMSYSWYITGQISGLRTMQRDMADRNRRDSIQLLRIQDDLYSLGLAMRDMLNADQSNPLTAWEAQFQRIRGDLEDAFRLESKVAVEHRNAAQQQYLAASVTQFWNALDRAFALATKGNEDEARIQIRACLPQQAAIGNLVARLLVENNESEEQTALQIGRIYDGVQRHVYLFLGGALATILLSTLCLIDLSRRLFAKVSLLSHQRSDLAQKLISTQESVLRHISRDLHDEFGQILTAIGAMLSRMRNQSWEKSSVRDGLQEICEITQSALDNVRSLSQALHPVILEEEGLESALDWYLPNVERQTAISIAYEKSGVGFVLESSAAVHIYRVLQEALNNAIRHSRTPEVCVRLHYLSNALVLEVEDHGTGLCLQQGAPGIGLVGMHERAEILDAKIDFMPAIPVGTLMRLTVPRCRVDSFEQQPLVASS